MKDSISLPAGPSLIVCSQHDLEQVVENVLLKHLSQQGGDHSKERITRVAAAKRLGKNLSTLTRWARVGKIHPIHVGASVFYSLAEVEAIEEGRL